jgi:hypothetical protein
MHPTLETTRPASLTLDGRERLFGVLKINCNYPTMEENNHQEQEQDDDIWSAAP